MPSLHSLLKDHRAQMTPRLRLVDGHRDRMLEKVNQVEQQPNAAAGCNDEQVWTYLLACGYAVVGARGVAKLARLLTGDDDLSVPARSAIWLEHRPNTPRPETSLAEKPLEGEGRSHIDLSIGNIASEYGNTSGIDLAGPADSGSWICFCEMKWEADIEAGVRHDDQRNQLIRIIESALYFRNESRYAGRVYVSLVTPESSKNDSAKLYHHKFNEYQLDNGLILEELRNCKLRLLPGFDAATRIDALRLQWQTFDHLFEEMPGSETGDGIKRFWEKHSKYLNAR